MWRPLSPEESAANWRDCRRYLKRYAIAAALPGLALLWAAGYGQGLIQGAAACLPIQRNEGVTE